jgi:thiol-disulfide isomerase/thioredoxin
MNAYHFTSKTCQPCKVMKPVFVDLKDEFPQFTWTCVDIGEDPQNLRQKYNVTYVPTLVVETPSGIQRHSGTTAAGYYRILRNSK